MSTRVRPRVHPTALTLCVAALTALATADATAAERATVKPSAAGALAGALKIAPKPVGRFYVAALGGYATGADTRVTLDFASAGDADKIRVVLRNLATGATKLATVSGNTARRTFSIEGYGPCPAGIDPVVSATVAQIPTKNLWEIDLYTTQQIPDPAKLPAADGSRGVIKTAVTVARAAGLRFFDPGTPPDGGANWNPDAHKAIDIACCDPTKRPGPEPWPEPEPTGTSIAP
jgi:hypothetical protein